MRHTNDYGMSCEPVGSATSWGFNVMERSKELAQVFSPDRSELGSTNYRDARSRTPSCGAIALWISDGTAGGVRLAQRSAQHVRKDDIEETRQPVQPHDWYWNRRR
jgi:hypothetical protein